MTRKHFTLIALTLRHHYLCGFYANSRAFSEAVAEWADALAETNTAFDRRRFYLAATEDTPAAGMVEVYL